MPAQAVVAQLRQGLLQAGVSASRIRERPLSDGGEGFLQCIEKEGGTRRWGRFQDPLGRPIEAFYLQRGTRAYIELAQCSGLELLETQERDPGRTSTFGTGQQVAAALDAGAREVVLGLGGSATNDGGCGLMAALGLRFLDEAGRSFVPTGDTLKEVAALNGEQLHPKFARTLFRVSNDVAHTIIGEKGASRVFAPQKGASPQQLEALEAGMAQLVGLLSQSTGQSLATVAGLGAAGGAVLPLYALGKAQMIGGFQVVAEELNLRGHLTDAAWAITGEGRLDEQSLGGKVPAEVARLCRPTRTACFGVFGEVALPPEQWASAGFALALALSEGPESLQQALEHSGRNLRHAGYRLGRCWQLFGGKGLRA